MAEPTPVNGQITDAVTQTNITAIGNAAAQALATLQQSVAFSMSLAMQNAVSHQQAMNALSLALVAQASGRSLDANAQNQLNGLLERVNAADPMHQVAAMSAQVEALQRQMQGAPSNGAGKN